MEERCRYRCHYIRPVTRDRMTGDSIPEVVVEVLVDSSCSRSHPSLFRQRLVRLKPISVANYELYFCTASTLHKLK